MPLILNAEDKKIIIHVHRSECGKINIPSNEMEFGDIERGWLAFGEIKTTPEQNSKVESEARERMNEKLIEMNVSETADSFRK